MKNLINIFLFLLICSALNAQPHSRQDSLRGSITPERAWWDLQHYQLKVTVYPDQKRISGSNTITYKVIDESDRMQLDLQPPMRIEKVIQNGRPITFDTEGTAHFLRLDEQELNTEQTLTVYFSGNPKVAVRPPWEGGFTWEKDSNGMDFIATSNQGIGSSVWWPNKDHPADEPDKGVDLMITAPKSLTAVGNGRLVNTIENNDSKTWHWKVVNPINNYGININVGDYVRFSEIYEGEKGKLDMDYWVLRESEEKARRQFSQAGMMMEAFEHWFGPYPFYEDSFKLVEVPYLGMEHQSSVTYGNGYQNGFRGTDLSNSGWGMKFDFIIIHEAGHEWFANSITNKDVADMWVHEGFTAYSENLYLDYHFGTKASADYVIGTRAYIRNDVPIIGPYGVNQRGSNDMYYKGSNILHTFRQLVEDDEEWRSMLRDLNEKFYHQTVSSKDVEDFFSQKKKTDLSPFFDQYLRTTDIPELNYKISANKLMFTYENIVKDFDMPLIVLVNGKEEWIFPNSEWKSQEFQEPIKSFHVKRDFYVTYREIVE